MSAHGYNQYANGCRCEVCREAKRDYERKSRKRRAANLSRVNHGKRSTYDAGCRCDQCYMARMEAYYRLPSEYQAKIVRRPSERLRRIGGKP